MNSLRLQNPQSRISKLKQRFTDINKNMILKRESAVKTSTNYMDFFFSTGKPFNVLSRIIIVLTNITIFEKFLESKIIQIKLQTIGKNKIKTKFLEIIFKEFWYLPLIMLFYNMIVITFIYILYFCFDMLLKSQKKGQKESFDEVWGDESGQFLFNTKIFTEMIILTMLSFIVNLIILIVIYYVLVVMSKEKVTAINNKGNNEITDGFIDKFYSYYRFSYYSSILFISIFLQTMEYNNWKKLPPTS